MISNNHCGIWLLVLGLGWVAAGLGAAGRARLARQVWLVRGLQLGQLIFAPSAFIRQKVSLSCFSQQSQRSRKEKAGPDLQVLFKLLLCHICQCPIRLPKSPEGRPTLKGHYCNDLHCLSHWHFGIFCHIHLSLVLPRTGGG